MRDLSLKDTVAEMKCGFKGCINCPYFIAGGIDKGCIEIGGASALYEIQGAGRMFDINTDRIPGLLNNELEEIRTEYEDYGILHIEQMKELLFIATPILGKFSTIFTNRFSDNVKEEWKAKVEKEFGAFVNYKPSADGVMGMDISNVYISIKHAYDFLAKAIELNRPVEVGRYDFKFKQYL